LRRSNPDCFRGDGLDCFGESVARFLLPHQAPLRHYGLGLFGRLGITQALTIGIAVYIAQVLFSA